MIVNDDHQFCLQSEAGSTVSYPMNGEAVSPMGSPTGAASYLLDAV